MASFYSDSKEELLSRIILLEEFWLSKSASNFSESIGINSALFFGGKWKFSVLEQHNPITTVFAPKVKNLHDACKFTVDRLSSLQKMSKYLNQKIGSQPEICFVGGKFFSVVKSTSFVPRIGETMLMTRSEISKRHLQPVNSVQLQSDSIFQVFLEDMPDLFFKAYQDSLRFLSVSPGSTVSYLEFCKRLNSDFSLRVGYPIACRDSIFQDRKILKKLVVDYERLSQFCGVDYFNFYQKINGGYSELKSEKASLFNEYLNSENYAVILPKKITYTLLAFGIGKHIALDDGDLIQEFVDLQKKVSTYGIQPPFMSYLSV